MINDNNSAQFDRNFFTKLNETYKISLLTSLPEDDVKKLLGMGFLFDYAINSFYSNFTIVNTNYNLKLKYYDGNYRLYVKTEKEIFTDKIINFVAQKKATTINSTTTYKYNIDLIFINFETWIKNIEFSSIKSIMCSKIPDKEKIEISYKNDKWEITKISKTFIYIKLPNGTSQTLEIHANNLTKEELLILDKLIEEKLKLIEDNKNQSFKDFVTKEKNNIDYLNQ